MKSGGNPRFTGPLGVGRSPTVERDRNRTADIRWAQYVAPISETEHWAKNLGNGQLYRVGSAGPVVFKRGQKVQLSSSTGIGPEIILGYPGSKKGGSSMTKRTFSKSFAAPTPPAETSYYGFRVVPGEGEEDPDTIHAILFEEGSSSHVLRGTAEYDGSGRVVAVARDSASLVGDGFAAWKSGGAIRSWDVEGEVVHTWSDSGVAVVTDPVYVGGYLYWWGGSVETSGSSSVDVSLWRARCNLSSATEVMSQSVPVAPVFGEWADAYAVCSESSSRAVLVYFDPNPDGSWPVHVSAGLDGLGFDGDTGSLGISTSASMPTGPALSGSAVVISDSLGQDRQIASIGTDLEDESVELWPDSGDWWEDGGFESVSKSHDGLQLAAVSSSGSVAVRGNVSGTGDVVKFSISGLSVVPQVIVPVPD